MEEYVHPNTAYYSNECFCVPTCQVDPTVTDPLSKLISSSVKREVEFVSDIWGRTMNKSQIIQISRIQNTIQYSSFQTNLEVGYNVICQA